MKATQGVRYGAVGSTISLSSFTPDDAGRLAAITHDVAGTAGDVTYGLDAYNPASQVTQRSTSNDGYVWTGAFNASHNYVVNGLNQYTSLGSAIFSYDANGNLTGDGVYSYVYDVENRMVSAAKISGNVTTASLRYDPLGRLYQTGGGSGGLTRFLYDGDELVAEFDGNTNILLRRYLHGVSVDDPVIAYEGAAFNQPRWLHTNHQGSVVAISDNLGVVTAKNTFDEWGIEGSGNASIAAGGRFSYTGQAWIPELGMYYYKARIYSATLGRFMQTDPIGYEDQVNLYAYVGNDPVNMVDPDGQDGAYSCAKLGTGCGPQNSKSAAISTDTLIDISVGEIVSAIQNPSATNLAAAGMSLVPIARGYKIANGVFKNVNLSEAKRLISSWSKGNHPSLRKSLEYHVDKHGSGNLAQYLRKADNFNYKGTTKTELENGATRWNRRNGEFIIKDEKGKIVSYGPGKSTVTGSLVKR